MNLDLPQIGGECQDFTRWWNSEGQFLQPVGDMQSEYGLDFAKKIAESVYGSTHHLITEAQGELETYKEEYAVDKTTLENATNLIKRIEEVVEITLSSKDKTIKDLIKDYREDNED